MECRPGGLPSVDTGLICAALRSAMGTTRNRTRTEIKKPWENLPDLVMVPDQTDAHTGIRGYRLLPSEARSALRRMRGSGGDATGERSDATGERSDATGERSDATGERSDATGE